MASCSGITVSTSMARLCTLSLRGLQPGLGDRMCAPRRTGDLGAQTGFTSRCYVLAILGERKNASLFCGRLSIRLSTFTLPRRPPSASAAPALRQPSTPPRYREGTANRRRRKRRRALQDQGRAALREEKQVSQRFHVRYQFLSDIFCFSACSPR